MKKIINFLFKSYHRPSAKIEHIITFFLSLILNSSSKTFSERMMLLKRPPMSQRYYNFLGRLLMLIFNFINIIIFRNFLSKEIKIESSNNKDKPSKGSDFSFWPLQPYHYFEKDLELDSNFYEQIYNDYNLSNQEIKNNNVKDSPWWELCRKEFNEIFLMDKKVNINNLKNFRNNFKTRAALLSDQNFINVNNSKTKNMILSLDLINLYHKLSEKIDLSILRSASESFIGNNLCTIYRGQRLTHRVLRHAYYSSQLSIHCKNFFENKVICDIGGGYGGLIRFLKHQSKNNTFVLVELPEVCLLANYFLKKCFPNSSIGTIKDFKDDQQIDKDKIKEFDFLILPQTFMKKFDQSSIDLFINTTSIGEMDDISQQFYINNIERIKPKYFYSVNRAKERKDKYNAGGFYNLNFNKRWKSVLYGYTHTYHIEFLGEFIGE